MNRLIVIAFLSVFAVGCATMTHGRSQTLAVTSEPSGATVTTRCGGESALNVTTPGTIVVSRAAVPCEIIIEKQGYSAVTVALDRKVGRRAWSNMTFAPLVGLAAGALAGEECDSGGFGSVCFSAEETGAVGAVVGLGFGGIGVLIDRATGAIFERTPATVHVTLPAVSVPDED